MSADEKVIYTAEQAIALLPDGESVHVFTNPAGMLLGADWERAEVEKLIRAAPQREQAGETATRMGHGLVVWNEKGDKPYFVSTRQEATP